MSSTPDNEDAEDFPEFDDSDEIDPLDSIELPEDNGSIDIDPMDCIGLPEDTDSTELDLLEFTDLPGIDGTEETDSLDLIELSEISFPNSSLEDLSYESIGLHDVQSAIDNSGIRNLISDIERQFRRAYSRHDMQSGLDEILETYQIGGKRNEILLAMRDADLKGAFSHDSERLRFMSSMANLFRVETSLDSNMQRPVQYWDKSFDNNVIKDFHFLLKTDKANDAVELVNNASSIANIRLLFIPSQTRPFYHGISAEQLEGWQKVINRFFSKFFSTYSKFKSEGSGHYVQYVSKIGDFIQKEVLPKYQDQGLTIDEFSQISDSIILFSDALYSALKDDKSYLEDIMDTNPFLYEHYGPLIKIKTIKKESLFSLYKTLTKTHASADLLSKVNQRIEDTIYLNDESDPDPLLHHLKNLASIDEGLMSDTLQVLSKRTLDVSSINKVYELANIRFQTAHSLISLLNKSSTSCLKAEKILDRTLAIARSDPGLAHAAVPIFIETHAYDYYFSLTRELSTLDSSISANMLKRIYDYFKDCPRALSQKHHSLVHLISYKSLTDGWRNTLAALRSLPEHLYMLLTVDISENDLFFLNDLVYKKPKIAEYMLDNRDRISKLELNSPFKDFYRISEKYFEQDTEIGKTVSDFYLTLPNTQIWPELAPKLEYLVEKYGKKRFLQLKPLFESLIHKPSLIIDLLSSLEKIYDESINSYFHLIQNMTISRLEQLVNKINQKNHQFSVPSLSNGQYYSNEMAQLIHNKDFAVEQTYSASQLKGNKNSFLFKYIFLDQFNVGYPLFAFYLGHLAESMDLVSHHDKGKIDGHNTLISEYRFQSVGSTVRLFHFSRFEEDIVEGFGAQGASIHDWNCFKRQCCFPSKVYSSLRNFMVINKEKNIDDKYFEISMRLGRIIYLSSDTGDSPEIMLDQSGKKVNRFSYFVHSQNPYCPYYRLMSFISSSGLYKDLIKLKIGVYDSSPMFIESDLISESLFLYDESIPVLYISIDKPYLLSRQDFATMDRLIYSANYNNMRSNETIENLKQVLGKHSVNQAIQSFDNDMLWYLSSLLNPLPYTQQIRRSYEKIRPDEFYEARSLAKAAYRKRM